MNRVAILEAFQERIAAGRPIVGSGAGTGLSARCAEEGGAHFLVVYNSGRYRMAGRSSMAGLMPYGDANAIMLEMGDEILTVVQGVPVLAGVCGTDPFRNMDVLLREVKEKGFSGVQNYPTVCLYDGGMRANLEDTGLGFYREVEMMRKAVALDLLTVAYVVDESDARAMAEVGVDVVVAHLGLTASAGVGGKKAVDLEVGAGRVQQIYAAAKAVRDDVLVMFHGGPVTLVEDAEYIFRAARGTVGFLGASSMERIPTEVAISSRVREFTDMLLER